MSRATGPEIDRRVLRNVDDRATALFKKERPAASGIAHRKTIDLQLGIVLGTERNSSRAIPGVAGHAGARDLHHVPARQLPLEENIVLGKGLGTIQALRRDVAR